MLIAFEGQDGAGKTSLLHATYLELERRGLPVVAVPEFSDSQIGLRLLEALVHDKFLRLADNDDATELTRALDIVADLLYLDECVIAPAMEAGCIVLKDRHYATVLSTLVPTLATSGAIKGESRAFTWIGVLLSELRWRPAVTVYVDAPLDVRLERIRSRTKHLRESQAPQVSADDLDVFAQRERVMRQLIVDRPAQFLTVDNGQVPLSEGVNQILAFVDAARSDQQKGETTDGRIGAVADHRTR